MPYRYKLLVGKSYLYHRDYVKLVGTYYSDDLDDLLELAYKYKLKVGFYSFTCYDSDGRVVFNDVDSGYLPKIK